MCGIVGYTGNLQAASIILDGLSKLEYRGYDSAGIAVLNEKGHTEVVKAKGRLQNLIDKTDSGKAIKGTCGIGHTRWATHGEPSQINAHPHVSSNSSDISSDNNSEVIGVHNGIIENYLEIKEKLANSGYQFYSQTDTEILIKLIDYYYNKYDHNPLSAISHSMIRVKGSYAIEVMFSDYPEEIYVARKDSPIIIGLKDDASFIASDVPAILKYTNSVYYLDNMEMARITKGHAQFYNIDCKEIEKEVTQIQWDAQTAEKGGYQHFMMKEICEQPKAVRDTLNSLIKDNQIILNEKLNIDSEYIKNLNKITIVACGSAWHVGMIGQYVIENIAKVEVRVELASEFRYRNPLIKKDDLIIVISQSGETADSLAALRLAKQSGCHTLAIVNVVGSSIAREADNVLYTLAGPEIAVATTKAYSAQLVSIYSLAVCFGYIREAFDEAKYHYYVNELLSIPEKIDKILENKERIQWFAFKYSNARDAFFIGRGIDYGISLEGSLKFKETSYIHSEAYAAGELKHGTISLIEDNTLVIGVLTQSHLYKKTISNMVECKTRGAYLMGLTNYGNYQIEDTSDFTVYIPKLEENFAGSLAVIPLQLLAYYVSVSKGIDPDKPRNLAKSVTVE
ncbi:MAG: glutamine--fructose-6-phosphate transaminase (isomerizing) [Erysipelotrichaceae bacterium]